MDSQIIEKRKQELVQAVQLAFQMFDKQNKGSILPEQIADLDDEHKSFSNSNRFPKFEPYEQEDCIEEFKKFDADGGLDLGEYYELVIDAINDQKLLEEAMEDSFQVFDRRHLGLINSDDFKSAMEAFGEKLTDEQLKDMMNKACYLNEKEIAKEDFVTQTTFRQLSLEWGKRKK